MHAAIDSSLTHRPVDHVAQSTTRDHDFNVPPFARPPQWSSKGKYRIRPNRAERRASDAPTENHSLEPDKTMDLIM